VDGSWVKLREVSLTYDFESDLVDRLGLDNLSLAVSGRNLFTWTDVEGFDPENNLTGASKGLVWNTLVIQELDQY
jgi:hypothetical protein